VTYDDKDKPLSGAWWRFPKWLWQYVMSVFRIQGMVKRRADSSLSFAVFHPFLNLTEELAKSFSPQEVSLSASSFMENNRASTELVNEVLRAQSRHRHARDADYINMLSSMLALCSTLT